MEGKAEGSRIADPSEFWSTRDAGLSGEQREFRENSTWTFPLLRPPAGHNETEKHKGHEVHFRVS